MRRHVKVQAGLLAASALTHTGSSHDAR
jgi:hypothetical protein